MNIPWESLKGKKIVSRVDIVSGITESDTITDLPDYIEAAVSLAGGYAYLTSFGIVKRFSFWRAGKCIESQAICAHDFKIMAGLLDLKK